LTMMMPLFMLLFEIPTGAVADIYGRKFSVLLGTIIEGIALISIFFLHNYYALLFAFAMIGLGSTFGSGASEAWIIDLIKKKKKRLFAWILCKKRKY
ncbi:MAG: MFS transporter, partial [Candidatus Woesearchaeota archaeon]